MPLKLKCNSRHSSWFWVYGGMPPASFWTVRSCRDIYNLTQFTSLNRTLRFKIYWDFLKTYLNFFTNYFSSDWKNPIDKFCFSFYLVLSILMYVHAEKLMISTNDKYFKTTTKLKKKNYFLSMERTSIIVILCVWVKSFKLKYFNNILKVNCLHYI